MLSTQGDVNYVSVVGQPIIVLNSYQAARDLLEKRGSIYSSRPRMVMLTELYVCFYSPWSSGVCLRDSNSRFQDGMGRSSVAPKGRA